MGKARELVRTLAAIRQMCKKMSDARLAERHQELNAEIREKGGLSEAKKAAAIEMGVLRSEIVRRFCEEKGS